ncbi:hypothetical protein C2G38_2168209 [Gigaspora rosea]|uniref:Uncharacterized protein n=1 Tax=Gigaspora rosea TaxID=44941 RepID=A0A397VPX9_9GLOM|nr:hypothetical protein C2G38_2168209 [Gigaspora rosea]
MESKIFMGDMPELMENILNNLNNEFDSLYSCTLVSRHWCKMSIPFLWQDPFSLETSPLFISKYLSSLGEDEKYSLKECGLNAEFSKTLFVYAKFLKVLDLSRLIWVTWKYLKLVKKSIFYNDPSINLLINLLFKLFMESGATLHKSVLYVSTEINPEIFNLLEQNKQFFSQLQDLSLSVKSEFSTKNGTKLLKILAKNTTKINALKLENFRSDCEPELFHDLISIIKSQVQLRRFSIIGEEIPMEFHGMISSLKSQTSSLHEVIIRYCGYSAEFEILKDCKNLETLCIRHCDHRKLLKTLNCSKLSTLEIFDSQIDALTIVQILEKSGSLLQRLALASASQKFWNEPLILETLKSFCQNLTYLHILNTGFSTQLIELIGNLQKLQFLKLWCNNYIPEEELKIRIKQFAEILPMTLQYLDLLGDARLSSYIDILLNHCNAPLNKLIIDRLDNEKNIKALIEFCIRNRTLNYVGVNRYLNLDDNIRKEVETYVALVPYERIIVDC